MKTQYIPKKSNMFKIKCNILFKIQYIPIEIQYIQNKIQYIQKNPKHSKDNPIYSIKISVFYICNYFCKLLSFETCSV